MDAADPPFAAKLLSLTNVEVVQEVQGNVGSFVCQV
jgi:hypothetical protein